MSEAVSEAAIPAGRGAWKAQFRRAGTLIGAILVGAILLFALLGPLLIESDPLRVQFRLRFKPPSFDNPFGTDHYGRSILARVAHGAHQSLLVGLAVVVLTSLSGALIGAVAGFSKRFDNFLMRTMDAFMAFPPLMLAIAIAAVLGAGVTNLVIALAIAYAPRTARVMRAAVISISHSDYIAAARIAGASETRIMWRHILPNSLSPLLVDQTFVFANAVLADAALSFLGVGLPPPAPSWGNIIAEGRDYVVDAPWITIFPGLAIAFTVFGLNLLGDGLRDAMDPRLRNT
jgi:peptide/nickel transport system permease protein